MMRRLLVLAAITAGALMLRPGATIPMPSQIDIVTDNCLEGVPEAAHVPLLDDENDVTLSIYLVGDRGVSSSQANAVLVAARDAYDPLNINLVSAGFRGVSLTGTDSQGLIDQTKNLFSGGQRPAGADVVWTLTTADLSSPGLGNAVAGQADCIGGVRYPQSAFLVGEFTASDGYGLGPIWFDGNFDAKVFAHETGHLLGAHHHYQDCATGLAKETGPSRVEVSPCTVMSNFVNFVSMIFSAAEGAVVRAHAEEWALP